MSSVTRVGIVRTMEPSVRHLQLHGTARTVSLKFVLLVTIALLVKSMPVKTNIKMKLVALLARIVQLAISARRRS